MILTLGAKRRLTIPVHLAPARPGDRFIAEFDPEEDRIVLRRISKSTDWLAVLKACPVKIGELPPRSRELPKQCKVLLACPSKDFFVPIESEPVAASDPNDMRSAPEFSIRNDGRSGE